MKPPSLDQFLASTSSMQQISGLQLLATIGLATALGALMAYVYRRAAQESYNPAIAQSIVLLTTLMALVMLIVGDTLSRAFGSVGILSMMRFRIKFKAPTDPLILLGGVVVGMACGTGMDRVAIAGALVLCLLILVQAHLFEPRPSVRSPQEEL
ncbi:MAG TPA: hypothetical protein V6D47_15440 [Oscillatoriaceae cyanobacterium]